MKVVNHIKEWNEKAIGATIGFFDGVHQGHRFLIREMMQCAQARQLPAAVITFSTHPRVMLQSDYQPQLLNATEEKLAQLRTTGVDYTIVMAFNRALAALSARDFMIQLAEQWHVKTL